MKRICDLCGREFDDEIDGITYSYRGEPRHLCCGCLDTAMHWNGEGEQLLAEVIILCEDCDRWTYIGDMSEIDEHWHCVECLTANPDFVCCEHCGEWMEVGVALSVNTVDDDGDATGDTVYLCEDCYDRQTDVCEDCGETFYPKDNMRWHGDECYCSECFDDRFIECDRCGEIVDRDDTYLVHVGRNDETWCESCCDNHAFTCEDCGERFSEDLRYWHGDVCYCEDCCPSDEDEGGVNDYSFKPEPIFQRCFGESGHEPYLGFELEAGGATGRDSRDAADELDELYMERMYKKDDGSIPFSGFEMVSHPMTLRYHEECIDWGKMLEVCRKHGMKSHDLGGKVGLHVHVSRSCLRFATWRVIDAFVNLHQEDFEKIGRRRSAHYYEYMYGRPGSSGNRYRAVNFQNSDTIEFRFPRGTLILNTFLATLEVIHSLWKAGKAFEDAEDSLSVPCNGAEFGAYTLVAERFKEYWVRELLTNPRYASALDYVRGKHAFANELSVADGVERDEVEESAE